MIFREGQAHLQESAWILIECKKESTQPSDQGHGIDQLKSYMSACPGSTWGMWTNSRYKAVYQRVVTSEGAIFEEPNDIPPATGDISQVDRPTRETLKRAVDDNLLFSFRTCHDHIYVTDGLQKQPAFFELLKVIFCKIFDERNIPHPLEFYATAKEKSSGDGRLTVALRIGKIFERVKERYPAIFESGDEIRLNPRSLAYVVGELQRYSFLDTDIDVKGKAYEELVGANLRGDRGEFFTPRNIQRMAIQMLDFKIEQRILDPACGTGGFLVIAMNQMIEELQKAAGGLDTFEQRHATRDRIHEVASRCFFGIDINPDLVKATKMNMVMNNDGSGNTLRQDALLHPHQWDEEFRSSLARALGISSVALRGPNQLGYFDVIATNPPFGSKLPIKDRETLIQYDLGHVWKETARGWERTDELQSSQPPEILFIERCWQFLKPGGRMAIVLPDAILGAPGLVYVRHWILTHCRVIASIDLHPDTFQPRNGTQTSVLLLQKKSEREMLNEQLQQQLVDYEIFMAEIRSIGHDKRGNTLYRRNADGEEMLYPEDESAATLYDHNSTGQVVSRSLSRVKAVDDDTPLIANEFLRWKAEAVLGW